VKALGVQKFNKLSPYFMIQIMSITWMIFFNLIEALHLLSSFDEKFDIHIVSKNVETHVKEIIENSINARYIFIQRSWI